MQFENVVLQHMGYALGPNKLTSRDIEARLAPMYQRLKLSEGRLEHMTGIKARQYWERDTNASEASTYAARNLFFESGFPKDNIDLLIHSAVSRDRLEPATAAYVHNNLKLPNHTQILDVSNACLGFVNSMLLAAGLIESKQIRNALIVAGENGLPLVEHTIHQLLDPSHTRKSIKPYFANLTIGAGAVAAILTHKDYVGCGQAFLLGAASIMTNSSHNHLCEGDTASGSSGSLDMQTDSEELLLAGVELAKENWVQFKGTSGWSEESIDCFISHQVGRAHQRLLFETLGLDQDKTFCTYPSLGNVGSVSLPITLAKAVQHRAIGENARIALLGIGSGLSSVMLGVTSGCFSA